MHASSKLGYIGKQIYTSQNVVFAGFHCVMAWRKADGDGQPYESKQRPNAY